MGDRNSESKLIGQVEALECICMTLIEHALEEVDSDVRTSFTNDLQTTSNTFLERPRGVLRNRDARRSFLATLDSAISAALSDIHDDQ